MAAVKVLVIDDDQSIMDLLSAYLTQEGFQESNAPPRYVRSGPGKEGYIAGLIVAIRVGAGPHRLATVWDAIMLEALQIKGWMVEAAGIETSPSSYSVVALFGGSCSQAC